MEYYQQMSINCKGASQLMIFRYSPMSCLLYQDDIHPQRSRLRATPLLQHLINRCSEKGIKLAEGRGQTNPGMHFSRTLSKEPFSLPSEKPTDWWKPFDSP